MSVYCVCIVIVISENIVSALAAQCAGRGAAHSRAANGTSRMFKVTKGGIDHNRQVVWLATILSSYLSVMIFLDTRPNFTSTFHVYKPV